MLKLALLVSILAFTLGPMQLKATINIKREKAELLSTIARFWQAYERKELATMSAVLTTSTDLTFFGSDAAEVIRTRQDWENLMRNDWQLFESTKFGEPRTLAIQISEDGKLASAVYEVSDVSLIEGKSVDSLDRFALTLRKE